MGRPQMERRRVGETERLAKMLSGGVDPDFDCLDVQTLESAERVRCGDVDLGLSHRLDIRSTRSRAGEGGGTMSNLGRPTRTT